jgi:type VII secretion-associated serine protease mycosin
VHAQSAWRHSTGRGIVVAVIDSGVAARNRNLAGRVLDGVDLEDPARPRGWYDPVAAGGHGTGVASIIAGTGRGNGVYGIAPDAKILPVRVTNAKGYSPDRRVGRAIVWAVDHGADVVNLSLGTPEEQLRPRDKRRELAGVRYALRHGVVVVAGAGNDGPTNPGRFYPAAFPGVIAVGGVRTRDGEVADFSDRGRWVDLAAPATSVWNTNSDGTRGVASGTSFASPAVAAVAALVLQERPRLRPAAVRRLLMSTARDVGEPGVDQDTGAGLVDAAAAVRAARNRG